MVFTGDYFPDPALNGSFLPRTSSALWTLIHGILHALEVKRRTKTICIRQKMVCFCTFKIHVYYLKTRGWLKTPLCFFFQASGGYPPSSGSGPGGSYSGNPPPVMMPGPGGYPVSLNLLAFFTFHFRTLITVAVEVVLQTLHLDLRVFGTLHFHYLYNRLRFPNVYTLDSIIFQMCIM